MKKTKTSLALTLAIVLILALLCGCGGAAQDNASAESAPRDPMEFAETEESYSYEATVDISDTENGFTGGSEGQTTASGDESGQENGDELARDAKLIYRVYMNIETLDYDTSVAGIMDLCEELGGYVEYSSIGGQRMGRDSLRNAEFVLRFPSNRLDEFESSCGEIGNVYSSSREVENATARYRDLSARLTAYETEEARLLELLKQAVNLEDVISLNARLSEVRYEIDSITSSLRNIDSLVSYSTVHINLNEVVETTGSYNVPRTFGERVSSAFGKGFESFKDFLSAAGVFILGDLLFILLKALLIIVPLGLIAYVVIIAVKKIKAAIKNKKAPKTGEENKTEKRRE